MSSALYFFAAASSSPRLRSSVKSLASSAMFMAVPPVPTVRIWNPRRCAPPLSGWHLTASCQDESAPDAGPPSSRVLDCGSDRDRLQPLGDEAGKAVCDLILAHLWPLLDPGLRDDLHPVSVAAHDAAGTGAGRADVVGD